MKILLGMSGGVDSAFSVHILKSAGHTVEGALINMHEYTERAEALERAKALGIPLHIIDLREEFDRIVKTNLVNEYVRGRTPNPCVICNSEIKLVYLYRYAMEHGFDCIATGHYASLVRTDSTEGKYIPYTPGDSIPEGEHILVAAAADLTKDQSYMLWRVPEYILKSLIFPLSALNKEYVKQHSDMLGLVPKDKRESQEICFIREGDYADFIESRVGRMPQGDFVLDTTGEVLGRHNGIIRYTIGQRKGLGISASARIFVTDINPETNTVTLSLKDRLSSEVHISGVVLPAGIKHDRPLSVKLRYAQKPVLARVVFLGSEADVYLETPLRAVTPGQSLVVYDGDVIVAGGFIEYSK